MKTLINFLSNNPSYVKCGNTRIAKRTGLKESTVAKFKKTIMFQELAKNYRNKQAITEKRRILLYAFLFGPVAQLDRATAFNRSILVEILRVNDVKVGEVLTDNTEPSRKKGVESRRHLPKL